MKTVIVANLRAGSGRIKRYWPRVHRAIVEYFGDARVAFTRAPGDATRLVRTALLEDGADRVILVGGDGTFNEGLNGFVDDAGAQHNPQATLALYPAGTGSDLARSLGLSGTRVGDAFPHSTLRSIDIGRATVSGSTGNETSRFFLNIASFGITGEVVAHVGDLSKLLGARPAYLLGTLRALATFRPRRVRLQVDDDFEAEVDITLVAVANGRYFGGSMKIAPDAIVDDGVFDVVIATDFTIPAFVANVGRIYKGLHIHDPRVTVHRGRRVRVVPLGGPTLAVEVDGEQPGQGPATFDLLPRAVRVFAPWSQAEAVRATPRGDILVEESA